MPSEHTVAALTVALTDIERRAGDTGWDANPAVYGLFAYLGVLRAITVDELPVDEAVRRLHDQIEPKVPYRVALRSITDQVTSPEAPGWLHHGQRQCIGFALLCAGPDNVALLHDPTATDTQVRAFIACDIDGRYDELPRPRGATKPTVTVLTDPPAATRTAAIAACLDRLVAAFGSRP